MLFLLVISLRTVALAVPGYKYDSQVSINFSTSQPLQHQKLNASPQGLYTQGNSVIKWKIDNFGYSQAIPHSLRYKKSFGQSFVLPGNNAQAHHTQRTSINSNVSESNQKSIDQNQASPLQTTAGSAQSSFPSLNNNYESSSLAGIDKKTVPVHRLKASSKPNNFKSFKLASSISHYSLDSGGKTDYVQSPPVFVKFNQGFPQDQTSDFSAPVSTSYMKMSNMRPVSNNRHMHISRTFPTNNKNFDLSSSYLPKIKITDINKNNVYTQTVTSSFKTYNNVYGKERGSSLVNSNFNNEKDNIEVLRASLGLDYSLSNTSNGGNEHDVFATRVTNSSLSGISSADQPQAPNGPVYVDLKQEIMHVAPLRSALGDSYQNILTMGDSLNVLSEKKLNSAMKYTSEALPKLLSPIIHKHIYLHSPPPDLEESNKVIPSAKKRYNILFIKVPPQESQTDLQNQNLVVHRKDVAVDDKTFIYVLLKNLEETNNIVLPQTKPTAQQVFFVKSNDPLQDLASQVNEELDKTESIDNIVPSEPNLVNGEQN